MTGGKKQKQQQHHYDAPKLTEEDRARKIVYNSGRNGSSSDSGEPKNSEDRKGGDKKQQSGKGQPSAESSSTIPHHHQCFICANLHPKYWVITECNHQVCWMCILRLRALYGTMSCPMCKTPDPRALLVRNRQGQDGLNLEEVGFGQLWRQESMPAIDQLKLWFEDEAGRMEAQELLNLNCPFNKCKSAGFASKTHLKRHVSSAHNLLLWY